MTTTYGRTLALSPAGRVLWTFTPASYATYAGSAQITTATPAADPDRRHIYAASPDGVIHKLAVASGREVTARGVAGAGHTAAVAGEDRLGAQRVAGQRDRHHGRVHRRRAALPGPRRRHQPRERAHRRGLQLALLGHAAPARARGLPAVGLGHLGPGGGRRRPRERRHPGRDRQRAVRRAHGVGRLGASARSGRALAACDLHAVEPGRAERDRPRPRLVGAGAPRSRGLVVVQGGKDGVLRLVALAGRAPGGLGGELQRLPTPGGAELFTAMAVSRAAGVERLFVADASGTAAYRVRGAGTATRLVADWANASAGTSPVLAGGLLYVYDPGGALNVYDPGTRPPPAIAARGRRPLVVADRRRRRDRAAGRRRQRPPNDRRDRPVRAVARADSRIRA